MIICRAQSLFPDKPAAAKVLESATHFKLRQRAVHVYSEADRVQRFAEVRLC